MYHKIGHGVSLFDFLQLFNNRLPLMFCSDFLFECQLVHLLCFGFVTLVSVVIAQDPVSIVIYRVGKHKAVCIKSKCMIIVIHEVVFDKAEVLIPFISRAVQKGVCRNIQFIMGNAAFNREGMVCKYLLQIITDIGAQLPWTAADPKPETVRLHNNGVMGNELVNGFLIAKTDVAVIQPMLIS